MVLEGVQLISDLSAPPFESREDFPSFYASTAGKILWDFAYLCWAKGALVWQRQAQPPLLTAPSKTHWDTK